MATVDDLTQRSYTLKLKQGMGPSTWKQELWSSHALINKGAYAFGSWFLTMAGGLDHRFADEISSDLDDATKQKEKKQRRTILALSWLTVERGNGLPDKKYWLADTTEAPVITLQEILKKRGLSEKDIQSWLNDCHSSLSANKRKDTFWINRSAMFDDTSKKYGLTREDAASFVFGCLGENEAKTRADYFSIPSKTDTSSQKSAPPKNMTQVARSWLSGNWGSGTKTDLGKMQTVLQTIIDADLSSYEGTPGTATLIYMAKLIGAEATTAEQAIENIKSAAGFRGRPNNVVFALQKLTDIHKVSAIQFEQAKAACQKLVDKWHSKPKTSSKVAEATRQYIETAIGCSYRANNADQTNEFSAFFDLALRRISSYRTWVQRAEGERSDFALKQRALSTISLPAAKWLSDYTLRRTEETGALEPYVLRSTAIGNKHQWEALVRQWKATEMSDEQGRRDIVKQAQADDIDETFGDASLFRELSGQEAWSVWHREDGAPDAAILENYVAAVEAEDNQKHFKVPCYCHPDPFEHPVFAEYGNSRWDVMLSLQKEDPRQRHEITLETWNGIGFNKLPLQWMSRRFVHDFALDQAPTPNSTQEASRADRLGRAAADMHANDTICVPVSDKVPVRLQLGRTELLRVFCSIKKNPDRAASVFERLNWFVTVSMPLTPKGPWITYAKQHDFPPATTRHPFAGDNKDKGAYAKKILEGLPHLRVMGVDLGLRYGAACTVLETLSARDIADACNRAGQPVPERETLYFQLSDPDTHRHVWYRRIGPDTRPIVDQSTGEVVEVQYPASWARFDRQFTIKLPGEQGDTRIATEREIWLVNSFRSLCGIPLQTSHRIDVASLMLMSTVDLRHAIKRHGDLARIAFYLTTAEQIQPGGRRVTANPLNTTTKAISLLVNFAQQSAKNQWVRDVWTQYVAPIGSTIPWPGDNSWQKEDGGYTGQAAALLVQHPVTRSEMARDVAEVWRKEDGVIREQLRVVRDWIFGQTGKTDRKSVAHMGGLSVDRLSAMQNFYKVSKAYYVRPGPDGHPTNRSIETTGNAASAPEKYGQQMLDALEKMREARVRQLAGRIAEAALGIGREPAVNNFHMPARMYLLDSDPRYASCQAIVIENLTRYHPDDQRPRRENRQLMQWAVHRVQDYLAEECSLHGIFLEQIVASYTSRQDCLSGAPGCRCNDMPPEKFIAMKSQPKARLNGSTSASERYEQVMLDLCQQKAAPGLIRFIRSGGEIFVSSDPASPLANGIQADMNASANIALRAVMEHDWAGRWWYVLVSSKTRHAIKEKYKGIHVVPDIALGSVPEEDQGRPEKMVNAWRTPDLTPLRDAQWYSTGNYWKKATESVAKVLQLRFAGGVDKKE